MDLTAIRFEGTRPRERRPLLASATSLAPARRDVDLEGLAGLPASILARAGLDPLAYRVAPLRRRLSACMRVMRAVTEQQALERFRADAAVGNDALSTLLIGVSEFFRDPAVFDMLREATLPWLARQPGVLRILSVGASSGAELYSVAMLLAEAGLLDRCELVGMDCRADAIRQATAGVFPAAAVTPVPPPFRARYFEPVADGQRVVERLRRQVTWLQGDATRTCPAGPWHLVCCRNLSIYLRPPVADAMFRRFVDACVPGGVLMVGKAERPSAALNLAARGRCLYEKRHD